MTPDQTKAERDDSNREKLEKVERQCDTLAANCALLNYQCKKLEACCAARLDALKKANYAFENCGVWKWKAEICQHPNSPKYLFHEVIEAIENGLSTDFGQPLLDENKRLREALETEIAWRYSHDEIEASCGGEVALAVREKVMKRRADILRSRKAFNP